jgi:transcriptional regulator with XRE-family HTH domain
MTTDLDRLIARARTRRRLPSPAIRRLLREEARLTQDDVAEALGVSRPAVTRYELGEREPRGQVRERYVELLDRLASEVAHPEEDAPVAA